jgi:hypothetical protein
LRRCIAVQEAGRKGGGLKGCVAVQEAGHEGGAGGVYGGAQSVERE